MAKYLLLIFSVLMSISSAFADIKSQCTTDEVTSTALVLGNSLYKGSNVDGIKIETIEQSMIGVHSVETYDLWLTSQGQLKTQIRLGFVVRSPGNSFYKKEGCGLITTSIPFFQAP